MHQVKCTVKSIKEKCPVGYQVRDHFFVKDTALIEPGEPSGICLYAFTAMMPYLTAYGRKTDEGDWINLKQALQCPDNPNSVVFGLERF
jgi:uncharacterized repeat protein (TIGR04076 family)